MNDDGYHAFVSYARDDCEQWAFVFIHNLETLGVRVWHRGRIQPGENRAEAASRALEQSSTFLLIASPGAILSLDVSNDLDQWGTSMPLVPIVVSQYEHPDDRYSGLQPIMAVNPRSEPENYRDALVQLATKLVGEHANQTEWSNDLIPERYPHPVSAELLSRAVDVVVFIIKFSAFWNDFARSLDSPHGSSREHAQRADHISLRREACTYIYRKECHKSIDKMARTMAEFRNDLEAAARLVNCGQSAHAWWRDAYARIEQAVEAAREEQTAVKERVHQHNLAERVAQERGADASATREIEDAQKRAKQDQARHEEEAEKKGRTERKIPSETRKDLSQMNTPSPMRVDFLIITALEEERVAVLSKLEYRKIDRDGADTHTYYEAQVKTKRKDDAIYHVIISSLAGMGPIVGALKASAVIKRWSPEHVLMVGIAGGVEGEVALGDVMVASQVPDYTVGKIHETGRREERWVSYPADANLLDAVHNFPSGWDDLIAPTRPQLGVPKRQIGVIASGGDVIASKEQIAIYRADWPKLIGVDMEGGGVAAGLHNDIERPRFLMIRGVSDLANGENNAEVKKAWRAHACDVAAAYAIGLLRDGPVPGAQVTSPAVPAAAPAPTRAPVGPVAPVASTAISATSTPIWEEFEALPRLYQVNLFDDIVLCMHPDGERAWRAIVPNAHTGVQCVTIRTPDGPWHRNGPPDLSIWKDVFQQIGAKCKEVRAAKKSRIHLVAKAPFSLGALLGRLIDPQDQLVVYQPDNKQGSKAWHTWGPVWPADPGTRTTPFFDLPPGLEQHRPEQNGHFALVVDITGKSNTDPCVEAVQAWTGGRPVQPLLLRARDITEQGSVRVPADVDKAAVELERLFQQIAEALPNATLHVFYYGPLGILVRACRRLGFRRTSIIVWDAYYPGAQWFPAVAFPEGKLLVSDGAR